MLVAATLALSLLVPFAPAGASASPPGAAVAVEDGPGVEGDDGADRYVGTGSVLLPRSFGAGERSAASSCDGCVWRLTTHCLLDIDGGCSAVVSVCPADEEYLRFWVRRPGESWVRLGSGCVGPGGPVTLDRMDEEVADRFVRNLPDVAPAAQPARGAVARIPVVFRSGQPARWPARTYGLLGFEVTVRATPSWSWRFGDGAGLRTGDPGGRWPDDAVAHAYRSAGERRVSVTTRWTATFTIDGLGPFPVSETVTQEADLVVRVGEGRAVLVG